MINPKNFIFPIIRSDFSPKPQPELLDKFEEGWTVPDTKCMRYGCQEPRWVHPHKGQLVLCHDHALAVAQGEAHAPSLRRNIDYNGWERKTFLVDKLKKEGE